MPKVFKFLLLAVGVVVIAGYLLVKFVTGQDAFGDKMNAQSLALAKKSPQFSDGHFENTPERLPSDILANVREFAGNQQRYPATSFPIETPKLSTQVKPGLRAIWFGHATVYVEIDGKRVMTDPMLSNEAFPVKLVAPTRYNPPPLTVDELPDIDFVTISHDHFDHLDMHTVQTLAAGGTAFFVGLGIKAHLMKWGVPEEKIHEMDWWQSITIDGFTIHCTPARHYSGRKFPDDSTLWSSWLIEGPQHRVYHSGDSGYSAHFEEIGQRFGPINIAFIKIGDYGVDPAWRDVHMHPENSVQAHLDLKAEIMFPIHWGTFNLSFHDWFEPINLAVEFAAKRNIKLLTPKLGQQFEYGHTLNREAWWKTLEMQGLHD